MPIANLNPERGLVIAPPVKIISEYDFQGIEKFDPVDIRKYVLYWDVIDFPSNNCFAVNYDDHPEISYLMKLGFAKGHI